MPPSTATRPMVDKSRIGDNAPLQPLSGIHSVDQSSAVNGLGRGGVVSKEGDEKEKLQAKKSCCGH